MGKWDDPKQGQAFERMMILDPWLLSHSAQVLWYRLNGLIDRQGGNQPLVLERKELLKMMAASYPSCKKARDELLEAKLLRFDKRKSAYWVEDVGG